MLEYLDILKECKSMPKKFLKKHLPHPSKVKENRYLKVFGRLLHDENLWHLNRRSITKATAIGLFCAFLPIPFQMVVAAGLAILWHGNILMSAALVWITNPLTMPAIFYFTYCVGAWILAEQMHAIEVELSVEWLTHQFLQIWKPLLLGSVICGVVFAVIGYFAALVLWRMHIMHQYRTRHKKDKHV